MTVAPGGAPTRSSALPSPADPSDPSGAAGSPPGAGPASPPGSVTPPSPPGSVTPPTPPGGAGRRPVTTEKRASARRAASDSGDGAGVAPARPEDPRPADAAARRSARRRSATGTSRAISRAPRSALSRPEKQNAPSASVQVVNERWAWMRAKVAAGSAPAAAARTAWHRSLTTWRGSASAPATRAPSAEGSQVAAEVSSSTLGPDRVPVRTTAASPGRSARRRPASRVRRARPADPPSKVASRPAADRWPWSSQWPDSAIRGASSVLAATTRRSRRQRSP